MKRAIIMPTKLENGYLPHSAKKPYKADIVLSRQDYSTVFDFAHEMAFGSGYHRSNRSGGSQKRNPNLIFRDVMEGKIGEFALYRYLESNNILVTPPDCSVHSKGVWDGGDFQFRNSFNISMKTSKHFAQLLLLEAKDYYIENDRVLYKHDNHSPDAIVFARTCNDIASFMKENNWTQVKDMKEDMYQAAKTTCEITGYITNKDLKNLIQHDFLIKKGNKLNGSVRMDANNYYIPAKEMKSKENLCETLEKIKEFHEKQITKERQKKIKLELNM